MCYSIGGQILGTEANVTRLRIRELATERGLNISTLSRRTDLAYTTTHALWHDSATRWSRATLEAIARVLGVPMCELFAEDETESTPAA